MHRAGLDFPGDMEVDELPHIADHVAHHLRPPDGGGVGDLEFGLDLILDGLERIRDAG